MEQILVMQMRGTIYENGYGLLPQKAMRDPKLTPAAKAIYAYICSFSNVNNEGDRTAFPGVDLMCKELNMKSDTFYKHRKLLVQYGYLTIEKQRQAGNKFDRNLYYINAIVTEQPATETPEKPAAEPKKPHPKKRGTEEKKPYPKKPATEKPGTEKRGTNITSLNITNSNINNENLNINPNPNPIDYLSLKVPEQLKTILKRLGEGLGDYNISEIQRFYTTKTEYIQPDCSSNDYEYLNDMEFTHTVTRMLTEVKGPIKNMEALLLTWVQIDKDRKQERVLGPLEQQYKRDSAPMLAFREFMPE